MLARSGVQNMSSPIIESIHLNKAASLSQKPAPAHSGSHRFASVAPNSAGLALGLLVGGLHFLWVLLIAVGAAQPLADFIFWLHFVRPKYVIDSFDLFRATALVLLSACVGYIVGVVFAFIWNQFHHA